ncbi:MAG TPA: 1,2-phenylacetyl-CoA epoxidase subunit PaaC [Ignavibacteria bacterium]|nr:1,2-phenylacetyl-CoA epoxidase subunit PaaC [Ignavibacteria bacterium]
MNETEKLGLKDLLFKMADDELILGHRNSEWTGLGPILEEDIAFSSMAQDKLGHAQTLYNILNELGEADADTLAFTRKENEYKCCHLVEYPIGEYDFSLMRQFLFDHAEAIRYNMLANSKYEPLANAARKFRGELRYHLMHADTWIVQLGNANEESNLRLQSALNECMPLALGIFEESEYESVIIESGDFEGEKKLQKLWLEAIEPILKQANLKIPSFASLTPAYGGRRGFHTEYLKPLVDEMTEVYGIDPSAEW